MHQTNNYNNQTMCMWKQQHQQAPSEVEPRQVDRLIHRELMSLTTQERNDMAEEVHGVKSLSRIETPALIDENLRLLELELLLIPDTDSQKEAYLLAVSLESPFVDHRDVRLKFLRAVFFDAAEAAMRMVLYLELVLEYFGVAALMTPIRLVDLDDDEKRLFREGETQILPERDFPLGRRILVALGADYKNSGYSQRNLMRIFLYCIWVISEDMDTQLHGMVAVFMLRTSCRTMAPDTYLGLAGVLTCIPIRISAIHCCVPLNDPLLMVFMSNLMVAGGKEVRIRSRLHNGNVTEIFQKLKTFSIPVDNLPLRSSGEVKSKNHLVWMNNRIALEHAMEEAEAFQTKLDVVECPRLPDVVFKIGERGTRHGNMKLRELVNERKERYHAQASRSEKNAVIREIVDEIQSMGGRFLAWDSRGWFVTLQDPCTIKKQVSTFIRDTKRRSAAKSFRKSEAQAPPNCKCATHTESIDTNRDSGREGEAVKKRARTDKIL